MAGVKWLPAALVAGVCLGSVTLNHSAAAATLTPASPTVIAGQSITLTLNDTISGNDGIGAVDLLITYDHTLLTLTGVTDGTDLINWFPATFFATSGLITISENFDDAQGTGSVVLLTFAATASDPKSLTTVTAQTNPKDVGIGGEYQLGAISDTVNINAAPVTPPATLPEPGTVALLLVPLMAAAGLTRRNRC